MVRNSYCVGNDGQRRIDCAGRNEAGRINDIQVVEVMSFAVPVEDAGNRIVAHPAGAVLAINAFNGDALFA
jgi:hypothetical protein